MSQNLLLTALINSLSTVLIIVYGFLVLKIRKGLGKPVDPPKADPPYFLSVIIPFRNEEHGLPELLKCLAGQTYLHYEVILIDDHSSDGSVAVVNSKIDTSGNFRLLSLPANLHGKKVALSYGIDKARGDIIVQTDADCRMGKDWLKSLAYSFTGEVKMLTAPVKMIPRKSWASKFAALEFLSLQASGLGLIGMHKPVMASAANLAYHKSIYEEFKRVGSEKASGDDVFLMQALAKREGADAIAFSTQRAAIVETVAPATWREFFRQRVRWGGKTTSYPSLFARFLAGFIAFYSLWMIALLFFLAGNSELLVATIGIWVGKMVLDYAVLRSFMIKTGQHRLIAYFPLATFIYPLYILITGIWIVFFSKGLQWKERPISPRHPGGSADA